MSLTAFRKLPVVLIAAAALVAAISTGQANASGTQRGSTKFAPVVSHLKGAKHTKHAPRGIPIRPARVADGIAVLGGPDYLVSEGTTCSSWFLSGGYWWYRCVTPYTFGGTSWAQTDYDYYYYVGDPHYGKYYRTYRCVPTPSNGVAIVGPTPSTSTSCGWI